jgi:hypothetical protein
MMDRRSIFFLVAAAACALLALPAPASLRWVPAWMSIVYALLTLVSFADHLANGGTRRQRDDQPNRPVM